MMLFEATDTCLSGVAKVLWGNPCNAPPLCGGWGIDFAGGVRMPPVGLSPEALITLVEESAEKF